MMVSEAAKRYAKALFQVTKDNNSTERVFAEIREIRAGFLANSQAFELLNSPLLNSQQKKDLLSKAVNNQVSPEVANCLALLVDKNRLEIFPELVTSFENMSDESHGVIRGTVRSAASLGPEQRRQIEATVQKAINKKVILSFVEDPSLLGGMIAQVGGWTFDDSLENHLMRLSEDLNRSSH